MAHHGRRRLAALLALSALTTLGGVAAAPSASATGCEARSTQTYLSQFGDDNDYFPVANAGFESAAPGAAGSGWSITPGVGRVSENSPWKLLGADHRYAASLAPFASMKAEFCVRVGEDSIRLFVKRPGQPGADLRVGVVVRNGTGTAVETNVVTVDGSQPGWVLTPPVRMPNVYDANGEQYVTLMIGSISGTWLVDDVLVDPWKTR